MEKTIQSMMKRYPMVIVMGFMIVIIAMIIGAANAGNAASYYAVEKATRDASVELAQVRAGIESITAWLPYFKFLGVAMILGGITMALGVISLRLRTLGEDVMASVPKSTRLPIPKRPSTALMMRAWMMMGMLIIVIGFIIALGVAGTASSVFSNPVVVIDAAEPGSAILTGLQSIHASEPWLEAFKFLGIAFFFMGIINGLATILLALNYQQETIPQVVDNLPETAPVGAD